MLKFEQTHPTLIRIYRTDSEGIETFVGYITYAPGQKHSMSFLYTFLSIDEIRECLAEYDRVQKLCEIKDCREVAVGRTCSAFTRPAWFCEKHYHEMLYKDGTTETCPFCGGEFGRLPDNIE